MHQGSCFCGAVKYEVKGEIGPITLCHCASCRKLNGTAFWAVASVEAANFHIVAGRETIVDFQSSPGVYRTFCGRWGSRLFGRIEGPSETIRLCIGALDTPVSAKPTAHIFVADKAEWFDIHDELPQFLEGPC